MKQKNTTAKNLISSGGQKSPDISINQKENRIKRFFPYCIISLVCLITYTQTIGFGFTGLDDDFFLVMYHEYFSTLNNFWAGFQQSAIMDYYRPVLFGSFMFDYQFSQTQPFFYHITNIIFHLGSCLMLFRVLEKLKFEKIFALLTTLIFTAHPLLTMAVAWIPGRNDSMLALLLLSALYFFINYIERRKVLDITMHFLLFATALYTKETSAFLPFVCILYLLLFTKLSDTIKPAMALSTGYAFLGLLWFAKRAEAIELANKNGQRFTSIIFGNSWLHNLPTLPEQIGKIFLPMNLSNFPKFSTVSTFLGLGVMVLLIVGIFMLKQVNWRMVVFSMACFFLFFIPTITFVFADSGRYDYLEHRIYVPFIAIIILVNELIRAFFSERNHEKWKKIASYGMIAITIIFSCITLDYSTNFKNQVNFWKSAVAKAPMSSLVYRGISKAYYDRGDLQSAEVYSIKGVNLSSSELPMLNAIGKAYESKDDLNGAERCYQQCLKADPNNVMILTDLGRIFEKKGFSDKAENQYLKAIKLDPNMWQVKFSLGIISFKKADYAASVDYWLDVVKVNPNFTDTYMNIAVACYYQQKYGQAIEWLEKVKTKGVDPKMANPGLVKALKPFMPKNI